MNRLSPTVLVPLRWSAVRAGGTLDLGFDVVPFDGATQRAALVFDVLTP